MIERLRFSAVFFALASLALTAPASAGGCCACDAGCAVPMEQVIEQPEPQTYIVDNGPVFSGPGHYLAPPTIEHLHRPTDYPYVGTYYYRPDGGADFGPSMILPPVYGERLQMHHWLQITGENTPYPSRRVRHFRHRYAR